MLIEVFTTLKESAGVLSLAAILFFWFYTFGKYTGKVDGLSKQVDTLSSKVDMLWIVALKNFIANLSKSELPNPLSESVFSSFPSETQKYIKKISIQKESIEWKIGIIISTIGLENIKKWSSQTDTLTILKCFILIIKKYSPPSKNSYKNHSNNSNKSGFS